MMSIEKKWFYNDSKEIMGETIICDLYVSADFNGMNQGTGGADCYIAFTLSRYGFFYIQAQSMEYLKKQLS